MDIRFRNIERAAKINGRNSPEDQTYLSARFNLEHISRDTLEVCAALGDEASHNVLVSMGFQTARPYQTPVILELHERFTEIFEDHIMGRNVPLQFYIQWISDTIKTLINLFRQARTGRKTKSGINSLLFQDEEDLAALDAIADILQEIKNWQDNLDTDLQVVIQKAQLFCDSTEDVPLGIRQGLLSSLGDAVCNLAQAVICSEQDCAAGGAAEWATIIPYTFPSFEGDEPYILDSIMSCEAAYRDLIPSIIPGLRRGHTLVSVTRQHLFAFRQAHLQNLADILLRRDWYRPH